LAKLLEYQGKDIFKQFEIPIPEGRLVLNNEQAEAAATDIGYPLVVKAQIYVGKRGRSGGIKAVRDDSELIEAVSTMLY